MIGIDIIDLSDPLLKERKERAFKMISHPDDPKINHQNLFWLHWTAKEAVYKCRRSELPFEPKKIAIRLSESSGGLSFSSGSIQGTFQVDAEYVLALAWQEQKPKYQVVERETADWSKTIRDEIQDRLAVSVEADERGLPTIKGKPICITHHGRFGAFAYP